jgi:hypothetical protein
MRQQASSFPDPKNYKLSIEKNLILSLQNRNTVYTSLSPLSVTKGKTTDLAKQKPGRPQAVLGLILQK